MARTYKAILHGDQIEWVGEPPQEQRPVPVTITLLEDRRSDSAIERGRKMAEALAVLAARATFAEITDPVGWQRETRHERTLPTRES